MSRGGVDLNEVGPPVLLFRGDIPGEANVYGQDPIRPVDGFSAVDDICADCRAVWWRPLRQVVALCRTFPGYGVCPADLSGKPQRHRSLPVGSSLEALSHGVPRTDSALDAVRRERSSRLAHYADFAQVLIRQARKLYAVGSLGVELTETAYALDSTTIDLCLSVFPWASFRATKAAVKMHTLLDLRGAIPSFIHISDGKLVDVHVLDLLIPEAVSIYGMDRGYLDFERLHVLHQAGAFFVTRAKSNLDVRRLYSAATDRASGIICDQTIALNGYYSRQHYPDHLRRIRLRDPESTKTLVFLSNQFAMPAVTIYALYKARWHVELFFKWVKQHLRIKRFYGTSENAVKSQIWIAVSVYVLVAIVKKRLNLDASLYTLLQILSVTLFEKMLIVQALTGSESRPANDLKCNQLNLFAF